jgi:lysophospholipase L1-like esterase
MSCAQGTSNKLRLAAGLLLMGLVASSLRPMPAAAAAQIAFPNGEQSYVSDQHGTSSPFPLRSSGFSVSKIYCMGDSLTDAGVYETELINLLGEDWVTVEKGISANTTADMLARFQADVIDPGDAAYVIIWGGTVDIVSSVPEEETETNLQAMYTMAHNAGIVVVAVTITPLNYVSAPDKIKILAINSWIQNTALDVDFVADAYTAIEDPDNPGNILPIYDSGDHAHLSNAGYAKVAETIYNAVAWTGQNQMLLTLVVRQLP